MNGLIPDPSRVRRDLTGLTKRAFEQFETHFEPVGEVPFPGHYTSEARYLAARIAVPHWFVRTQVGRAANDRRVNRTPSETVAEGGNCVDRSVLLGSIWATLSVGSELLSIDDDEMDASHLTAVATVPAAADPPSPEAVTDELVRIYADLQSRSVGADGVTVLRTDDDLRVVADPVFCDFAGDVGSMVDYGFATLDDGAIEWSFHNVVHDVVVPIDAPAYARYESA